MSIIGLTGKMGSGKTTVLKMLAEKGAKIFNADSKIHKFYKDSTNSVCKKVIKEFPESKQGAGISRKKLAQIVFKDRQKLRKLEEIIHPEVIRLLREWIKKAGEEDIYVAEIALLFEKKLEKIFDKNILVKVRDSILFRRLKEKHNFSDQEIKQRLSLYLPVKKKGKKSDFVLENNLDLKNLEKEVNLLWQKINKM